MRGRSSFVYITWPQFLSLTVETRIFKTFLLYTRQSEKKTFYILIALPESKKYFHSVYTTVYIVQSIS